MLYSYSRDPNSEFIIIWSYNRVYMYVDKCVMSRSTFIPLKHKYGDDHKIIIMYVIMSNNFSMISEAHK